MSESNYLPTGDQNPFAQPCKWQSRGDAIGQSDRAPVGVGSVPCVSMYSGVNSHEKSKYLSNYEQSDCAGSRADSGVSMNFNSCTSFDNLSSIREDSRQLPDITRLNITGQPTVTVNVRVVVDEATSVHYDGSFCTDTVCDSIDEGLGSDDCISVNSIPQTTSVSCTSSRSLQFVECERFQQNEDGDTLLHLALICGEETYAEETIKMAMHRESLSIYNYLQQTPLHLAVLTNQPSLVKLLVTKGAIVDARDRLGNTPLHLACRKGLYECVISLTSPVIMQSALQLPVFAAQQIPQDMTIKNYEGETCLHMAAMGCHLEIINYLTRYSGADVNAKEGKSGRTIIHLLAEQSDASLLHDALCLPGANVNALTYNNSTPLSLAYGRGRVNIETVLRAAGASMTPVESDSDSDSGDDMMDFNDFQIGGHLVS